MSNCHDKAVELGNMVLAHETSLRLADARAAYEADAAAQAAYAKYEEFRRVAGQSQDALEKLIQLEIDAKKLPAVQEYLRAQEDYNNFAGSVIEMLRLTIGYDKPKSGCGGGCCKG